MMALDAKYDLLFERFLNPDRVNLPDIDTDFDDADDSKEVAAKDTKVVAGNDDKTPKQKK